VERGVSQAELRQILNQLRTLARSTSSPNCPPSDKWPCSIAHRSLRPHTSHPPLDLSLARNATEGLFWPPPPTSQRRPPLPHSNAIPSDTLPRSNMSRRGYFPVRHPSLARNAWTEGSFGHHYLSTTPTSLKHEKGAVLPPPTSMPTPEDDQDLRDSAIRNYRNAILSDPIKLTTSDRGHVALG
jgi:hypothetical protein